jgi:hypothetical protein
MNYVGMVGRVTEPLFPRQAVSPRHYGVYRTRAATHVHAQPPQHTHPHLWKRIVTVVTTHRDCG